MTENTGNDHATTLGTTGVPYRSEQAEQLIADRMAELSASGRQANRMAVVKELAASGQIQTISNTHDFEAELQASIAPEQRGNQQAPTNARLAGRTLAEARALQVATDQARARQRSSSSTNGTVVRLSEQEAREQRIRRFTDQGYARWDAERRVDWQDQQARRQQG